MMNLEQIIGAVQEITVSGLPIMEGREKLEVKGDILNRTLTVDDYGFLEGDDGQFAVITIKEYPNHFIYGSSVVTGAFLKFEALIPEEDRNKVLQHGLTFRLEEVMSKNKRKYTKITFFPKN